MKIRDKIKQIYSLYQEYSPLYDEGEEFISLELEKFIFKVIGLLSIEYFGIIVGPVIQGYCVYSCWGEEHSQRDTINMLLNHTREAIEEYCENCDSSIDKEKVIGEIKRMKEREEELEKRTEMLERFYNNGGYKSVGNVSSEEVIVGLEKALFGEEDTWGSK